MTTKAVKKRVVRRPRAATREIIGEAPEPVPVTPKWQRYHKRLLDLHTRLLNRKGDLVQDAIQEQPAFSLHMADAGTDAFDQDLALSMISSEQDALYEVEEAISRIKDGTFGICQITGREIEAERLNAIPWTRFSAAAEEQLEREGAVQHTHLGSRETVTRPENAEEGEEG